MASYFLVFLITLNVLYQGFYVHIYRFWISKGKNYNPLGDHCCIIFLQSYCSCTKFFIYVSWMKVAFHRIWFHNFFNFCLACGKVFLYRKSQIDMWEGDRWEVQESLLIFFFWNKNLLKTNREVPTKGGMNNSQSTSFFLATQFRPEILKSLLICSFLFV